MEKEQGIIHYIKEYLAIVDFLKKVAEEENEKVVWSKGYLCLTRENMITFLEKNHFETAENKLKIWKGMHWIQTSEGHMTSLMKRNGKVVRRIKIDTRMAVFLDQLVS